MLRVIWASGIITPMDKSLENREIVALEAAESTADSANANENQPQVWTPEGTSEKPSDSTTAEAIESSTASISPREIGGRNGPEPTRFGDWEKNGRCIDF